MAIKHTKAKGTAAERELLKMLWNNGYGALRCPGSGSTPLPSPDILTCIHNTYVAIEVKVTQGKIQYFRKEQIDELQDFAEKFNAIPAVAVKFYRKGWIFMLVDDLTKTKGNNYVMKYPNKKQQCITNNRKYMEFEDFIYYAQLE